MIETPPRVARAFEEHFSAHSEDAAPILRKTFEETEGYDEMIVPDTDSVTSRMLECFRTNSLTRQEFVAMVD